MTAGRVPSASSTVNLQIPMTKSIFDKSVDSYNQGQKGLTGGSETASFELPLKQK